MQNELENELEKEIEKDIKTGLDPSDTQYYQLNGEPFILDETEESDITKEKEKEKLLSSAGVRFLIPFLLGALCLALTAFLATDILGLGRFITESKYEYYKELDSNYGKYAKIMKMIGEDPIAEYEPEEIDDDKLKELVESSGDPYAAYYTAEEYKIFERKYSGDYVGIGVGVVENEDGVVVMSVVTDSPADEAGMQKGDIIKAVDGKKPDDIDDAVAMISGENGTKVEITVERDGAELDFTMNRAKIDQESVFCEACKEDPEIGYIYISSFKKDTAKEFKLALKDLKDKGCKKFIIDLRDNGGGLVDQSVKIADRLLPACRIMSEKKKDGTETVYNSKAGSEDIEYVVLVNGNTASASEILTAAIQDNGGGKVIGSTTYGKGVTQTSYRFDDGSAVKMTYTEYFRPNGDTVNGVGITPDIKASDEEAYDKALEELRQ